MSALSAWVLPHCAIAQIAAGQDGHANDANTRVGSGGYNGPGRAGGTGGGVTPNDIVNRNVTGGKEFRGPVNERDPRAFTGPTAGNLNDVFVRQSNGAPSAAGPQQNYGMARPFYGESRFVNPPVGSIPEGFNGGYIGTTLSSPSSLSNGFNTSTMTGLQSRTVTRDTSTLNGAYNPDGYTNQNSALEQGNGLEGLSLYGQRLLQPGNPNNAAGTLESPDHFGADDQTIMRMRQELRDAAQPRNPNQALNGAQSTHPGQDTKGQAAQPQGLNPALNSSVQQPFDAPVNSPLDTAVHPGQLNNSASPLSTNAQGPAGARAGLIPPEQQSSLLRTLQDRLKNSSDVSRAMADARAAHPPITTPAARTAAQGVTVPKADEGPVPVSSLATGIKAKGLRTMLAGAEDLMRKINTTRPSGSITSLNASLPIIPSPRWAGRHAELAGAYYAKAEQDLRQVFKSDPELLMAQFDLKALIPKERLDFIRKDLKDLTQKDSRAERPWFLLAYLDYNSGDVSAAANNLTEAERRSAPGDWAIRLLRQHWALESKSKTGGAPQDSVPAPQEPAPPSKPDLNK